MRKQNSKNNLDEMQEQTLLKIESRGCGLHSTAWFYPFWCTC